GPRLPGDRRVGGARAGCEHLVRVGALRREPRRRARRYPADRADALSSLPTLAKRQASDQLARAIGLELDAEHAQLGLAESGVIERAARIVGSQHLGLRTQAQADMALGTEPVGTG